MKKIFLLVLCFAALPMWGKKPQKQPKAPEPTAFDLLQAAWAEATGDTATLVLEPAKDTAPGQTISAEQMTPGGAHVLERVQGQVNNVEIISGTGVNDEAIIRFRQAPSILSGSAPPPIEGWRTYNESRDQIRTEFNQWLRNSPLFDGCIDFDIAVRDKNNPRAFAPGFDSGDHLHPSEAAYKRMAEAVPLDCL